MAASDQSPLSPELLDHEKSYHGFNVVLRWCMLLLATALVVLTVAFATPLGGLRAVLAGVVVYGLGYLLLVRHEERQPLDPWAEGR